MMTSETRNEAFTLIELLLVLAIVSLAAATVAPLMAGSARTLAGRAAAYEMLSVLRHARWYAADTGRSCVVRISPDESGYRWEVFEALPDRDELTSVDADWARPALLEHIDGLMKIPPDLALRSDTAMDVRMEPSGVDSDYVIDFGDAAPMRIEVRRPSGLVWLVDAKTEDLLDRQNLTDAQDYWARHCSTLLP
jgi:type II secretion system protein H